MFRPFHFFFAPFRYPFPITPFLARSFSLRNRLLCSSSRQMKERRIRYQLTLDGGFPPPEEKKSKIFSSHPRRDWEWGTKPRSLRDQRVSLLSLPLSLPYRLCFRLCSGLLNARCRSRPRGGDPGGDRWDRGACRRRTFVWVRACVWEMAGWSGVVWRGVYSNNIPIKLAGYGGSYHGLFVTVTVTVRTAPCLLDVALLAERERERERDAVVRWRMRDELVQGSLGSKAPPLADHQC